MINTLISLAENEPQSVLQMAKRIEETPHSITSTDNPIYETLMKTEGELFQHDDRADGPMIPEGTRLRLLACSPKDDSVLPFRYLGMDVWINKNLVKHIKGDIGEPVNLTDGIGLY